jgi:hypothetical protein
MHCPADHVVINADDGENLSGRLQTLRIEIEDGPGPRWTPAAPQHHFFSGISKEALSRPGITKTTDQDPLGHID